MKRKSSTRVREGLQYLALFYTLISVFALTGWDNYTTTQAVIMLLNTFAAFAITARLGLPGEDQNDQERE